MAHRLCSHHPQSLELAGRDELLNFTLTFLTSTWYIKNPFLKAKLVEILFFGAWPYRGNQSLLGANLNASKVALDHLMKALMHFYIGECFGLRFDETKRLANVQR